MDSFNLAFLPSLHLFSGRKVHPPMEEKQASSVLLNQKQPGEMEPSACLLPAGAGMVHASQNLPHTQTCHEVKTATSEIGPWEAAREGAGVKTRESVAVPRHLSDARLTGKLCSFSKENESVSSAKEVVLLHNHLSTPVLIPTFLLSSLS